ncbi:Polycomb protein Asx [Frankliniella fusca]|uniref:Polycomb protein Asx n=1 Tax=Frankliniella fusca TaxID=407009 RepID=A0AAE1GQE1_9NEOP|nr:Polycomb protein Asx [Frankliniella fusca]
MEGAAEGGDSDGVLETVDPHSQPNAGEVLNHPSTSMDARLSVTQLPISLLPVSQTKASCSQQSFTQSTLTSPSKRISGSKHALRQQAKRRRKNTTIAAGLASAGPARMNVRSIHAQHSVHNQSYSSLTQTSSKCSNIDSEKLKEDPEIIDLLNEEEEVVVLPDIGLELEHEDDDMEETEEPEDVEEVEDGMSNHHLLYGSGFTHQSTMREVLASIPGFRMRRNKRGLKRNTKQSTKKLSAAAQLRQTEEGLIDLETPDSILVNTNLRALLNKHTLSMLPPLYQHKLTQLLPPVDRVHSSSGLSKITPSGLNNEFFARACHEWRDRLAEGEFTTENQQRLRAEAEREKNRLDPWKLKHFEPIWGWRHRPAIQPHPPPPSHHLENAVESVTRAPIRTTIKLRQTSAASVSNEKIAPTPAPVDPVQLARRLRSDGAVTRAIANYRDVVANAANAAASTATSKATSSSTTSTATSATLSKTTLGHSKPSTELLKSEKLRLSELDKTSEPHSSGVAITQSESSPTLHLSSSSTSSLILTCPQGLAKSVTQHDSVDTASLAVLRNEEDIDTSLDSSIEKAIEADVELVSEDDDMKSEENIHCLQPDMNSQKRSREGDGDDTESCKKLRPSNSNPSQEISSPPVASVGDWSGQVTNIDNRSSLTEVETAEGNGTSVYDETEAEAEESILSEDRTLDDVSSMEMDCGLTSENMARSPEIDRKSPVEGVTISIVNAVCSDYADKEIRERPTPNIPSNISSTSREKSPKEESSYTICENYENTTAVKEEMCKYDGEHETLNEFKEEIISCMPHDDVAVIRKNLESIAKDRDEALRDIDSSSKLKEKVLDINVSSSTCGDSVTEPFGKIETSTSDGPVNLLEEKKDLEDKFETCKGSDQAMVFEIEEEEEEEEDVEEAEEGGEDEGGCESFPTSASLSRSRKENLGLLEGCEEHSLSNERKMENPNSEAMNLEDGSHGATSITVLVHKNNCEDVGFDDIESIREEDEIGEDDENGEASDDDDGSNDVAEDASDVGSPDCEIGVGKTFVDASDLSSTSAPQIDSDWDGVDSSTEKLLEDLEAHASAVDGLDQRNRVDDMADCNVSVMPMDDSSFPSHTSLSATNFSNCASEISNSSSNLNFGSQNCERELDNARNLPIKVDNEAHVSEMSTDQFSEVQTDQIKLELEVTVTPDVHASNEGTVSSSSTTHNTAVSNVIPPPTIVCLSSAISSNSQSVRPSVTSPLVPPSSGIVVRTAGSNIVSSSALPYIALSSNTPLRTLATPTSTLPQSTPQFRPKQRNKDTGQPGKGRRNNSSKPPPGAVNLERSYQICQAVIQNSPNRDQLRFQLKPPPSLLASNAAKPSNDNSVERASSAQTQYGAVTSSRGPRNVSPNVTPAVVPLVGGSPAPALIVKQGKARQPSPPVLVRHVFTSQQGIPVTMAVLPQSQSASSSEGGENIAPAVGQMAQYILLQRADQRTLKRGTPPRASSAPPSNNQALSGVVGTVRGRPSSVDADCSQPHQQSYAQQGPSPGVQAVTRSVQEGYSVPLVPDHIPAAYPQVILHGQGQGQVTGAGSPGQVMQDHSHDTVSEANGPQNDCACNLKAMVMCKQCGAFCHDDCMGPMHLCVMCLIR